MAHRGRAVRRSRECRSFQSRFVTVCANAELTKGSTIEMVQGYYAEGPGPQPGIKFRCAHYAAADLGYRPPGIAHRGRDVRRSRECRSYQSPIVTVCANAEQTKGIRIPVCPLCGGRFRDIDRRGCRTRGQDRTMRSGMPLIPVAVRNSVR